MPLDMNARALHSLDEVVLDAGNGAEWAETLIAGLGTAIAVALISIISVLIVIA